MNELTEHKGSQIAAHDEKPTDMLSMIAQAVANPAVDVAKMQALLDMKMQVEDREAKKQFITAKAALQAELPIISKRGEITNKSGAVQSRYANWDDIHKQITPLLVRHGFVLDFEIGRENNFTTVEAVLSHVGGHIERSGAMHLPADTSGNKNDVQAVGSTLSYGKRYTTLNLLNILTEGQDNDAMTPAEQLEIMDEAEHSASLGIDDYQKWWAKQKNTLRLKFVENGDHERLKKIAAKADETTQSDQQAEADETAVQADDDMFPGDR